MVKFNPTEQDFLDLRSLKDSIKSMVYFEDLTKIETKIQSFAHQRFDINNVNLHQLRHEYKGWIRSQLKFLIKEKKKHLTYKSFFLLEEKIKTLDRIIVETEKSLIKLKENKSKIELNLKNLIEKKNQVKQ